MGAARHSEPERPSEPERGYLDGTARRERIERQPFEREVTPWPAESPDHAPAPPPYADDPGGVWGTNPGVVAPDAGAPGSWGWRKQPAPPLQPHTQFGWRSPAVPEPGPALPYPRSHHGHYQGQTPAPAWVKPAGIVLAVVWIALAVLVVTGPGLGSFLLVVGGVAAVVGYALLVLKANDSRDPGSRRGLGRW